MEDIILVTGASGYIASHVVNQLLQQNYKVRGTVRNLKDEKKIQPICALSTGRDSNLELVEADLLDADCWKSAVEGCTFVIHMASPFPASNPKNENELIKPAVEGTLNVLRTCKDVSTVKRVVLTSSVAAVSSGQSNEKTFTEEHWTDISGKDVNPYEKSKTLAEKAAWDFMKEEKPHFELAVINPALVMGPVLCGALTTSMEIPKQMMQHEMPLVPRINYDVVDVRDVAAAHIAAMKVPEAAGHRHIVSSKNMWFQDIALVLKEEFGKQGYNIPTKNAPYPLLWVLGRVDATVKMLLPEVGKVIKYDNKRMQNVLGIHPKDVKETLIDMCYSMIENGMIKKTKKYQPPSSVDL